MTVCWKVRVIRAKTDVPLGTDHSKVRIHCAPLVLVHLKVQRVGAVLERAKQVGNIGMVDGLA